jgi:hypothetical protein
LGIERERIASQERIAGMQAGIKAAKDKAELQSKERTDGLKIGSEIARNRADIATRNVGKPTQKEGD